MNEDKEAIIRHIEGYLERAKSGDVLAIAIASVHPGGVVGGAYEASDHFAGLLGSMSVLQHRLLGSDE